MLAVSLGTDSLERCALAWPTTSAMKRRIGVEILEVARAAQRQRVRANVGKRLVKAPKVHVRDSRIVHTLLRLDDLNAVLDYSVASGSREDFVPETLLAAAPLRTGVWFYRTAAGTGIDLVLEMPVRELWAVEIRRALAPGLERGFHHVRQDLRPSRALLVGSGVERHPKADGVEVIGLAELVRLLREIPWDGVKCSPASTTN